MSATKKPKKRSGKKGAVPTEPKKRKAGRRKQRQRSSRKATVDARSATAAVKKRQAKNASGSGARPKRLSALDAAAQILKKTGKPMRCQELIASMAEQGLWSSPRGKTPHATLYSAILREMVAKGRQARFVKIGRGEFAFNAVA